MAGPMAIELISLACARAFIASKYVLARFRPLNVGRESDINRVGAFCVDEVGQF